MSFWVLSLAFAQLGPLAVDGETTCPQVTDVADAFARLSPASMSSHRARLIQRQRREIDLTLLDASGTVLAHRTLVAATCQGLLEAAAATLFAWEATFPQPAPPPVAARSPLPAGANRPGGAPVAPSPVMIRVDLSPLVALSGCAVSPGVSLALLVGGRQGLWSGRLSVKAATPSGAGLALGRVEWVRPSLGLGPAFRLVDSAVLQVEASASFEAGLVSARGVGFNDDHTANAFDPAIGLAVHVAHVITGRLSLFAELAASFFLLPQVAQVAGFQVNLLLPPASFELRAGASWGS